MTSSAWSSLLFSWITAECPPIRIRSHSSDEQLNISHSQISLFSNSKSNNVDMNEGLSTVDRLAIPSCQNLLSFRPTTMHCIDSNASNNYMNIVMMKWYFHCCFILNILSFFCSHTHVFLFIMHNRGHLAHTSH